jgi:tetratricopeptide (TPR) repeat protein
MTKICRILMILFALSAFAAGQSRSLTVITEPNSAVWIDSILFGKTGSDGSLKIRTIPAGAHTLYVRADGFKEASKPLTAAQSGEVKVALIRTDDPAELAFQQALRLAAVDREKAAAGYRSAIKIRPNYTAAYIGLARVLSDAGDLPGALKAIRDLRRFSPRNAEASAIEGRTYKDSGEEEKAIASFKRAITEGRGFQPEALTGLGILYKEKAEAVGGAGEFDQEAAFYDQSVKYLREALKQLSGAPDSAVLYQLVGLAYERQKKFKDAIAVYNEFIDRFPNSSEVPTVRSFITQLQKQMADQP